MLRLRPPRGRPRATPSDRRRRTPAPSLRRPTAMSSQRCAGGGGPVAGAQQHRGGIRLHDGRPLEDLSRREIGEGVDGRRTPPFEKDPAGAARRRGRPAGGGRLGRRRRHQSHRRHPGVDEHRLLVLQAVGVELLVPALEAAFQGGRGGPARRDRSPRKARRSRISVLRSASRPRAGKRFSPSNHLGHAFPTPALELPEKPAHRAPRRGGRSRPRGSAPPPSAARSRACPTPTGPRQSAAAAPARGRGCGRAR